MSRPRNPNGVRRKHYRNGHPVRSTSIKGRKPPKRRLNAGARRRAQSKPLLLAAGTLAGLGALDAILTGRWGGALILGLGAGGFLLGHLVWSRHKNRQATRSAKPKAAATQQRRRRQARAEVLQREKDAARRAGLEPAVQREMAAARAEKARVNAEVLR